MAYLMIYDDSTANAAVKIANAIAAYQRRFNRQPTVVLVNAMDLAEVPGVRVQSEGYIRPNTFWVGMQVEASARL